MPSSIDRRQTDPLSAALRQCRTGLVVAFVFSLALNLLMLVAPLYTLQVFDRVLTSRSVDTLVYLTLVTAFALVILWGLDIARGRVMVSLGIWLERRVGADVLAASLSTAMAEKGTSAQILRDLSGFRAFLTGPAVFPILDAPWTPIFLAVVFVLHPMLGWFALAGALVLLALGFTNDFLTRRPLRRAGKAGTSALEEAQAAARNADVVHAMGMMPNILARWAHSVDGSLSEQAAASRTGGLITASSKSIRLLLQIGIMGLGAWLVLQDQLTAGGMIAGSILMARALAPIEQAIALWRSAIAAHSSYQRVKQALGTTHQPEQSAQLPAPEGHLQVESVSFAHSGEMEPMIRNVSFALKAGESLGLIGPTAAGKTTLARILVGNLKPQFGHARLDGADLATWHTDDRGQYIGYLPQDVELFSGTILDNIARLAAGEPDQVYDAARIAGVHDEILRLPNGYDTRVGIGGITLSGGQRQKIALARAVYGNPRLVVLDEPNSNLDLHGEAALVQALEHLRENGATVVIIAHRPSVLRNIDRILVLRNGTIDMMGPRDEVFEKVSAPAEGAQSKTQNRGRASRGSK